MTLVYFLGFIGLAFVLGAIPSGKLRGYLILGVSTLALYILQPQLPIRYLGFWLPTVTLAIISLAWVLITPKEYRSIKGNWQPVIIIGIVIIGVGTTRNIEISFNIIQVIPPPIIPIFIFIIVFFCTVFLATRYVNNSKYQLVIASASLVFIFILLKSPLLTTWVSKTFRNLTGQSTSMASAFDIRWLGFSYIAFRVLHTFRDSQTGRVPSVFLHEYLVYVLFFPSVVAGPIDRLDRFVENYRNWRPLTWGTINEAGKRLIIGLFKKFVIADSLAVIALNANNVLQVKTTGWTWFLVYAFSLQLFFDFSGYTDLAIGMGKFLGINLPENFNKPYLKNNLTQFWNSWHMTLTQWFRMFFFNPLTRKLRSGKKVLPIPLIIFITQISTMMLIGFWHGIAWNYLIWGLWHGMGLFIQNRWSEYINSRLNSFPFRLRKMMNIAGIFLTFNYVALGWVFFVLETPKSSFHVLAKLFGFV